MIYENTPTLETERLILRKFAVKDTAPMLELLSDAETNTFLPWFPLKTESAAQDFLTRRFIVHYTAQSAYRYAVCLKENGRAIGYVCLSDDESHDFGYGLKKEFWHKGIMAEASAAVVQRIGYAGYPYITATHDINNPRSGAVMKKLGMLYQYSYVEQWQPKNFPVTFRMYQLNFDDNSYPAYVGYWNLYPDHFVEENV